MASSLASQASTQRLSLLLRAEGGTTVGRTKRIFRVIMQLTLKQLESVAHIPTSEVKADLADAENELHGYVVEKDAIESVGINVTNKVRHYFLSAKIDKGNTFISELNQILVYRKSKANESSQPT